MPDEAFVSALELRKWREDLPFRMRPSSAHKGAPFLLGYDDMGVSFWGVNGIQSI